MPAEQNPKLTAAVACERDRLDSESTRFVPVAIPENLTQSRTLKADLEAFDIPAFLEAEMDEETLGGIPVLVPEGIFERASEVVGLIELNALDDDDFEEDEDEEEEEEDEEWDEEDFDEDDEDEEDEDEEEDEEDDEEGDEEFEADDFDDLDDEDIDDEP